MVTSDRPKGVIVGDTPPAATGAAPPATTEHRSYVDWAAVLAGALLAAAIALILLIFGSAIGLNMAAPGADVSPFWFAIAAGLWLLWVLISSFMAGSYLAGRLRRSIPDATEDEVETRDGSHGLLVWALGTLLGVFIIGSGIGGALRTATEVAASGVGEAVSELAGEERMTFLTDQLFRGDPQQAPTGDPEARQEVGRILTAAAAEGELAAEDRSYIAGIVAAQTGLDEAQAEARVNQIAADLEATQQEIADAADAARRNTAIAGYLTAAALLVSAAAAFWAAKMGGQHRDQNMPFPEFPRRR